MKSVKPKIGFSFTGFLKMRNSSNSKWRITKLSKIQQTKRVLYLWHSLAVGSWSWKDKQMVFNNLIKSISVNKVIINNNLREVYVKYNNICIIPICDSKLWIGYFFSWFNQGEIYPRRRRSLKGPNPMCLHALGKASNDTTQCPQ